jgi:hypothetical protein
MAWFSLFCNDIALVGAVLLRVYENKLCNIRYTFMCEGNIGLLRFWFFILLISSLSFSSSEISGSCIKQGYIWSGVWNKEELDPLAAMILINLGLRDLCISGKLIQGSEQTWYDEKLLVDIWIASVIMLPCIFLLVY